MIEKFILSGLSKDKLSILMFHKVPVARHVLCPDELGIQEFEQTIDYVQKQFEILPLNEAVERLRSERLPRRAACITFDDGYPDWETGVVPLLLSRNLPATFFITAGQFQGAPMWNERILHGVGNCSETIHTLRTSFLQEPLPFCSVDDRRRAVTIIEKILKFQSVSLREEMLTELEAILGVEMSATPSMSAQQLRQMHNKGFEIGAHTVGHPILTCCSDSEAREEIGSAREILAGITGSAVNAFAYPNGLPGRDFSSTHVNMVKSAGYRYAVTTGTGAARWSSSPFQIPRFTPWGPTSTRRTVQVARNILTKANELPEIDVPKRALMVAFHFPPQAGSSGILRTLNFVRYLPQSGWQPLVLSAHPRAYEKTSEDLLKSIPAGVKVLRCFALDAARHLSIKGKYSQWLALPDRWSSWLLGGVVAGLKAIRHDQIDLLWSTYPIATSHMIASSLARKTGLPWVADFRDPMVGNPSNQFSKLRMKFVDGFEARIMRDAACCIFTTERAAEKYRNNYPFAAEKCRVIENGYDETAFSGAIPSRHGVGTETLFLLHSGVIYPGDRDPTAFFKAVANLIRSGYLDRTRLCIRFRAPAHGDEVMASAQAQGVADIVDIAPPVPYRDAIAEILAADILLVFQGSTFNAQIPAKIYEYLRAARPIFGVVDTSGDTATRLRQFAATSVASISDPADIEAQLKALIEAMNSPDFPTELEKNAIPVQALSRESQTKQLAKVLTDVLSSHSKYVARPIPMPHQK
jgi:peptidoglycan/xylan/chitin deacetylase (PgdA/CDA1 family)